MKGPSGRGRYMVQRQWHCSHCGRQRVTAGSIVHLRCDKCAVAEDGSTPWMQLVEEPPRRPVPPPVSSPSEP